MALIDLLNKQLKYSKVKIHPELRVRLFDLIKIRFENEVTPEAWNDLLRSYEEDEFTPQIFIEVTIELVKKVVIEYLDEHSLKEKNQDLIDHWVEILWEDSQSLWYQLSAPIKQNIDFIGKLLKGAKDNVLKEYPECEKIFGDKAFQFLLDLVFQSSILRYTVISKPDIVDLRRMLNISGQIVEEIFSNKIFHKELSIGEAYRLLDSFNREESSEKKYFFNIYPTGKVLLRKPFLENLKVVVRSRNPYSHGGSQDSSLEDDFSKSINALVVGEYGVLNVLYKFLKELN